MDGLRIDKVVIGAASGSATPDVPVEDG